MNYISLWFHYLHGRGRSPQWGNAEISELKNREKNKLSYHNTILNNLLNIGINIGEY